MAKRRERRRGEVRAATVGGKPGVTLHAITPNVVDDYGSVWMADVFDKSLARRLPTLLWAHDTTEPLGPAVEYRRAEGDGPDVDFAFSDFEAVPMAYRAHTQVGDGTVRDCSVGFSRVKWRPPTDEEKVRWPGCTEVMLEADLDEISLVHAGAIPGAKVLSVRAGGQVDIDAVVALAKKKAAGELTDAEAQAALDLLASVDDSGAGGGAPPPVSDDGPSAEEIEALVQLDAEADAALAAIGRSAPRS